MGREGHLNTDDLLAALDNGFLDWAMLDVFPKEPLDDSSPLWDHPRVFLTPHIGAQAIGSTAENHVVAKIRDFRRAGLNPPDALIRPSAIRLTATRGSLTTSRLCNLSRFKFS